MTPTTEANGRTRGPPWKPGAPMETRCTASAIKKLLTLNSASAEMRGDLPAMPLMPATHEFDLERRLSVESPAQRKSEELANWSRAVKRMWHITRQYRCTVYHRRLRRSFAPKINAVGLFCETSSVRYKKSFLSCFQVFFWVSFFSFPCARLKNKTTTSSARFLPEKLYEY